ncbi:MAG: serine O-acetyltransferase EpsC [Myxococcales bacterium]|nr:serine acetyltransferase [Myxococcota bacterium]MDW8282116.1 serine O-acetyltransferase EpsC [Myxococcales bacterium]
MTLPCPGSEDDPGTPLPPSSRRRLNHCELAEQLVATYGADGDLNVAPGHELPSPEGVALALDILRGLLYPGYAGEAYLPGVPLLARVEAQLARLRVVLSQQIYRGLHHRCPVPGRVCTSCEHRAEALCDRFLAGLPALRLLLLKDVRAAYEGDPAATGTDEVVFSYPGLQAVTIYRVAHALHVLGAAIVPRMMTEQAHSETGIDIHPGATVGESFFIDHGTGVVIGETTVIGNRVRIYQGVTLGALSLPPGSARQNRGKKRHPTIEDDVIIYANATILGGDTVIGRGAVIGGNTWVTSSVPPGTHVTTPCR